MYLYIVTTSGRSYQLPLTAGTSLVFTPDDLYTENPCRHRQEPEA